MSAPLRELGEKIIDTIERPSRREARSRSCNQILLGGQRGKDLPTLGHEAETCLRDPVWGQPDEGYAFENGTPAAGGLQTPNGTKGRSSAHSASAPPRPQLPTPPPQILFPTRLSPPPPSFPILSA